MTTIKPRTCNNNRKSSQGTSPGPNFNISSRPPHKASIHHLEDDVTVKQRDKSLDAISTNTSEDIHKVEERPLVVSEGQANKKTPPKGLRPTPTTFRDEGTSDNSENSPNISGKFVKVRVGGIKDTEPLKPWENDIDYLFSQDRSKFIGEFHTEDYKIIRGYLQGSGMHLRMYYTKVEPFKKKVATMCIVHGLGGHSGRFMDVKLTNQ